MSTRPRVVILFGGCSSEHEVSKMSARSVIMNIDKSKYDTELIGITRDGRWLAFDGPLELLETDAWQEYAARKNKNAADNAIFSKFFGKAASDGSVIAFPVMHGRFGEDGTIQGLFEMAGIPYAGSGVLSSSLCMDKAYTKIVLGSAGIPQCKYLAFNERDLTYGTDDAIAEIESELGYPCFVKPSNAGSSIGITKAHGRDELEAAISDAFKYDIRIVIEENVKGRELECAVLGNDRPEASSVGEVVPCNEFYDYNAKYFSGDGSVVTIPAAIPPEIALKIRELAVKSYLLCDCSGFARVDFFLREDGTILLNEINTIPGFTNISMYSKLWKAEGVEFPVLVDRLISLALERFRKGESKWATTP